MGEEVAGVGRPAWPGYLCALGAAGLWALSATLAKRLFASRLDALSLAQSRSLLGFLCLWPALYLLRRPLVRLSASQVPFLAAFGLNFALLHATYYYAISRMPVAVAILIQYMAPLLILLYVRCFTRRPVGARLWGAAAFCLAGCALVVGVRAGVGRVPADGLAAGFGGALTYATYVLLAESGGRRLSPWTLLCYGLGFAAVFWGILRPWWRFPGAALMEPLPGGTLALPAGTGALVLFIAVCGTLLPFGLVALALRRIPAGPVGITTTAEPVVAACLAFALLGERLTGPQIAGGVLVLAGILLAQTAAGSREGDPP